MNEAAASLDGRAIAVTCQRLELGREAVLTPPQHWFVSSRHLDPGSRAPNQPWVVAAPDVDADGVRDMPHWRSVKRDMRPNDVIWVWDARRGELSQLFRAERRRSHADGDVGLWHPFYEGYDPVVLWEVSPIGGVVRPLSKARLLQIWSSLETGGTKPRLFTRDGNFVRHLYCYGPLDRQTIEALVQEADLGGEILHALDGMGADLMALEDARRRIYANLVVREGQIRFRADLLKAYDGRCAVTGSAVEPILQAAHIVPYNGRETNHVSNGLLLRIDIHALFDAGLIGVDPDRRTIWIDASLYGTEYDRWNGRPLHQPTDVNAQPRSEYLLERARRLSGEAGQQKIG